MTAFHHRVAGRQHEEWWRGRYNRIPTLDARAEKTRYEKGYFGRENAASYRRALRAQKKIKRSGALGPTTVILRRRAKRDESCSARIDESFRIGALRFFAYSGRRKGSGACC